MQVWDAHAHVHTQILVLGTHRSGNTCLYTHTTQSPTPTHLRTVHINMEIHMARTHVCARSYVNTHLMAHAHRAWWCRYTLTVHLYTGACTYLMTCEQECHSTSVPPIPHRVCLSLLLPLLSPCQRCNSELKASSLFSLLESCAESLPLHFGSP